MSYDKNLIKDKLEKYFICDNENEIHNIIVNGSKNRNLKKILVELYNENTNIKNILTQIYGQVIDYYIQDWSDTTGKRHLDYNNSIYKRQKY
jgi:hypothetical protein